MERDALIRRLEGTTTGPSKVLSGGGILIGHVPSVAPLAYLHTIFAPLEVAEFDELEQALQRGLPSAYRDALTQTNGLKLFVSSIAFYGFRLSVARSGDSSRQPYSIVTANTLERPRGLKDNELVVGTYSFDGSILTMTGGSPNLTWRTQDGLHSNRIWPSLDEFLSQEIPRLEKLLGPGYATLRAGEQVSTLPMVNNDN